MPRIDPLLTAMISNRADAVRLSDGDIAHIVKGSNQHALTRQPLAEGQLLILLREMAAPDVAATLGGLEPAEFKYSNAEGRFVAQVTRENGTLTALVRADESPLSNGNTNGNGHSKAGVHANGNGHSNGGGHSNGNGHAGNGGVAHSVAAASNVQGQPASAVQASAAQSAVQAIESAPAAN